MNQPDYSTMKRILGCDQDHSFMVAHGDPQKFQGRHVGCGGYIKSSSYVEDESKVFYCKICGSPEQANYIEPMKSELIAGQVCHLCHFWQKKIEWRNAGKENAFVIKGNHCVVDKDEPAGQRRWSGCGGSKFHIRRLPVPMVVARLDGKELPRDIITHNLWHQGKVPERFRDILTDNAEFIYDEQNLPASKT